MPPASTHAVTLTCHSETITDAVRRIDVRVGRMPDGVLNLTYILAADLDRLRVPPARPPRAADRLWQHTCFEAFVSADAPGYHECNFSPSHEWAVYAFERYRERAPRANPALDPQIAVRRGADKLELDARIDLNRLSPAHPRAKLSVALSAVIEDSAGVLSYWALAHPLGQPDFHHPHAFTLELPGV